MGKKYIQPPFAWLGRQSEVINIIFVVIVAGIFRFTNLFSLPPGLTGGEAAIGLRAQALLAHGTWPGLTPDSGYAPAWVALQAVSVKIFGATTWSLRLWPALLGTVAVLLTWAWVRQWFGVRIAWLASLLLAVTPWAVTLSRSAGVASILPLVVAWTILVVTTARRRPGTISYSVLAAVLGLNLLLGPGGWLITGTAIIIGLFLIIREHKLWQIDRPRIIGAATATAFLAFFGYLVGGSLSAIKAVPQTVGLTSAMHSLGSNLLAVLLMFNTRATDENFTHNLAGEPLLNAFIGLMLVTGLLVAISRLHERLYRLLLVALAILILPAIFSSTGAPNSTHAAAALPLVLVLCAVGLSYMLELWYKTFPINSAARATGQAAIIVLLCLTAFQGYTQYFRAWASTNEVYTAYNEGAVLVSRDLPNDHTPQHYVVAPADQQLVIAFLTAGKASYQQIQPRDILTLPVSTVKREFIIVSASRDEAVKSIKLKFPGGILRPHFSNFNQSEIYYTYEAAK